LTNGIKVTQGIAEYLAGTEAGAVSADHAELKKSRVEASDRIRKLLSIKGRRSASSFHRELGLLMWDKCGMARNAEGLRSALEMIPALREEFWENVNVPGSGDDMNRELEKAGHVADFLEFGELLVNDALTREESCGGHFREEHQTEEGEAVRDDENFSFVSAWEYTGETPILHKEELEFEEVHLAVRSYK